MFKSLVLGAAALTLIAGAGAQAVAQDYDHDRYDHARYDHVRYDYRDHRGYYYRHTHGMRRVCRWRHHRRFCVTRRW